MATISWQLHHLVQIGHKHKIGLMPGSRKKFGQAGLCLPCQLVHLDRQASHVPCPQCCKLVDRLKHKSSLAYRQRHQQQSPELKAAALSRKPQSGGSSLLTAKHGSHRRREMGAWDFCLFFCPRSRGKKVYAYRGVYRAVLKGREA
jgi:hypothetical protein